MGLRRTKKRNRCRSAIRLLAMLLVLGGLAIACGRKGPPHPPAAAMFLPPPAGTAHHPLSPPLVRFR